MKHQRRIGGHVSLTDRGAIWNGSWAGDLRYFRITQPDGTFHEQGSGDTTRTFRMKIFNRISQNPKFKAIYGEVKS